MLILSVIPVPETPAHVPYLDKAVHLGEYWVFAMLLALALRQLPHRLRQAWLIATAYGAMIELIQAFIPWRSAELADAIANTLGAALGIWTTRH